MSSARLGRPTGRNIPGGLPTSPRARSTGRNDVREREADRHRNRDRAGDRDYRPYRGAPSPSPAPTRTTAPTPSIRTQRSMANMLPSRRGGPSSSSSSSPDVPPLPHPRRSDDSDKSSTSTGSSSSTSASSGSSSSTSLDRMKGRGGYGNVYGYGNGYGSSRTSVEEELELEPKEEGRGGWLRQRMAAMPEREYEGTMDRDDSLPGSQSGYGVSLWSRVATAASTLTISVSKAWASGISAHPGERTPPGEESRLTRALKAYHIDMARDPADLPEWLFEEHERRPIGRSGTSLRHREGDEYGEYESRRAAASTPSVSGRGLRDVAAITSRQQPETRESSSMSSMSRGRQLHRQDDSDVPPPPSKANDRLRALRDAKRKAALRNASVSSVRLSGRVSDEWLEREERGRSYRKDGAQGDGPHRRAPSLPASVRPPHASGLPPRPGIRRI